MADPDRQRPMKSWFAIDGDLAPIDFEGNTDTRFPEPLVEIMVRLFSRKGDYVLDPFCGFGTTLNVCSRLGRNAVGFERDGRIYRYARETIVHPSRLYHDHAENIASYGLPEFDLVLASPPFRSFRNDVEIESEEYYCYLLAVFTALRPHLKLDGYVVLEAVNLLDGDRGPTVPRAFRSALTLMELFDFDREYVCCNRGETEITRGYHHSYLLVFRNRAQPPAAMGAAR